MIADRYATNLSHWRIGVSLFEGITFVVGAVARESVILACIGFLIGGIDDLALDAVYWLGRLRRRPESVTS